MTRRLPPVAVGLVLVALVGSLAAPAGAYEPTDPDFPKQWALRNTGQEVEYRSGTPGADVDAVPAWDLSTGAGVVIGVIDTGVLYDDADLDANMWENPGLTIDDKACPTGTHGYDFAQGDCQPYDGHGHGTGVSKAAAGEGNNGVGGLGLAWNARVMALRVGTIPVLNATTNAALTRAVRWAIDARKQRVNVRVLNISWGGDSYYGDLRTAIEEAGDAGILVVAASGNDSNRNNDEQPTYPCANDVPTLICVGGSDQDDGLVANWGPTTVDLVAPAVNLGYGCNTGTSCAAPLVSAAAALIWSREPNLSVAEVKGKILTNVDPLPDPADRAKVLTGGRLNAHQALTGSSGLPSTPTTTAPPSGNGGSGGGNSSSGGGNSGSGGAASPAAGGGATGGGSGASKSGGSGGSASSGSPGSGGTPAPNGGARGGSTSRGPGTARGGGSGSGGASSTDPSVTGESLSAYPPPPLGGVKVIYDADSSPGGRGWPLAVGTALAGVALAGVGLWRRRPSRVEGRLVRGLRVTQPV